MGKLEGAEPGRGVAEIDLRDDLSIAAHWMLGKLTVIAGHSRALCAADEAMSEAERLRRRREIEDAVAKCNSILSDLVRGLPPDLARARLSGR